MKRVIIVGAGPCGMYMALLLAKFGVRSLVLDKHAGLLPHPKAMGMTRRSGELFRQLGLEVAIMEKDFARKDNLLSVWARSLSGEILAAIPEGERFSPETPCHAFHCPQTHTESLLLEALSAEPLAEIRREQEVVAISENGEGAWVEIKDRRTGAIYREEGSYLIGADGDSSFVREAAGIERDGPGSMGNFLSVYFKADYGSLVQDRQAVLYQLLDTEYFEFLVAVDGQDHWLMHHFLQPGESPSDYTPDTFAAIIQKISGRPDIPVEVMTISPWMMSPKLSRQFRKGRVLLVGDAAARLSPAGGLGLNTGLHGVHNLAWKLAAVMKEEVPDQLLDTYHSERHQAARWLMETTVGNSQEIFEIVQLGLQGAWDEVRYRASRSRRKGAGLGQDLGVAYKEGALLPDGSEKKPVDDPLNEYHPDARPGERAPHCWLRGDGQGGVSTLDLYGSQWVLLTPGGAEAWEETIAAVWPVKEGVNALRLCDPVQELDLNDERLGQLLRLYGLVAGGAVLVRPDGYVAARTPSPPPDPESFLRSALKVTLS